MFSLHLRELIVVVFIYVGSPEYMPSRDEAHTRRYLVTDQKLYNGAGTKCHAFERQSYLIVLCVKYHPNADTFLTLDLL